MAVGKLPLRLGHRERDPIGQLEAALLAQRVDVVDELVRLALEHELVVETEVERDRHAVARRDRPALAPASLDEHLVRRELVPARPGIGRQAAPRTRRPRAPRAPRRAPCRASGPSFGRFGFTLSSTASTGPSSTSFTRSSSATSSTMAVEARPLDDEPAQRLPQLDARAGARLSAELDHAPHGRDLVQETPGPARGPPASRRGAPTPARRGRASATGGRSRREGSAPSRVASGRSRTRASGTARGRRRPRSGAASGGCTSSRGRRGTPCKRA